MAKSANLRATLIVNDEATASFGGAPQWAAVIDFLQDFGQGVTANTFDIAYMAQRTVNSASNDDIDLAGVLTTAFGATITAAEIVAIIIMNKPTDGTVNTTNLTIGAGTNPWIGVLGATHTIGPIRPGGVVLIGSGDAAGIGAVVAGTGDILRVANSSGALAKYQIGILARSS